MKKICAYFAFALILSVFLVGCSNSSKEKETESVEETKTSEKNDSKEGAESVWPKTYVDALGKEVVLQEEPKRVVSVMHLLYPDVLLSLDIVPVGIADADKQFNKWEAYQPYVEKHDFEDVGETRNPNIEKIIEQEPDLIMASAGVHDQLYDQLSAIAPVVYLDQRSMSFDRELGVTEISSLFGKEAEGEKILEEVNNKIAEGRQELANFVSKGETVVFTSVNPKGNFWLYGQNIAPTNPENGLGLKVPEGYPKDIAKELSMEGMSVLNPDHLFIFLDKSGYTVAGDALKGFEKNSVWNNINAVKNGNVYIVDRSLFAQDAPIATIYGIDQVVEILKDK
jgi:iron complex transport system substrate-binding protein